jgi:hypothetical protein
VRYTLKTPYRDGTTHIVLEPLDLMARLAALVPPLRLHLTRYHGVFAPHRRLRGGAARATGPRGSAAARGSGSAAEAFLNSFAAHTREKIVGSGLIIARAHQCTPRRIDANITASWVGGASFRSPPGSPFAAAESGNIR